jgi:hypothetical protein
MNDAFAAETLARSRARLPLEVFEAVVVLMQYLTVMIELVFVDPKVSIKLLDDGIESGTDARFHSVQTGVHGVETGVHGVETGVHGVEAGLYRGEAGVYCGESSVDGVESSGHGRKAAVRPALEFCKAAVHPPLQRREAVVHAFLETSKGHASAADHSIV